MKTKAKSSVAVSAILCALCAPCVLPTAAAETIAVPIVAETLLDDGTTNTWTQADLVAALGLLNRRYRRDIRTASGRRAWHGAETAQALVTNAAGRLVMRRTYADGFVYDDVARAQTAREAASNMAARVRVASGERRPEGPRPAPRPGRRPRRAIRDERHRHRREGRAVSQQDYFIQFSRERRTPRPSGLFNAH